VGVTNTWAMTSRIEQESPKYFSNMPLGCAAVVQWFFYENFINKKR
jgi:hypothetical protein